MEAFKEFKELVDQNKKKLDDINNSISQIQEDIGTLIPFTHFCYIFETNYSNDDISEENYSIQWNPEHGKLEAVLFSGHDFNNPVNEKRWNILNSPIGFRIKPDWNDFLRKLIEFAKISELKKNYVAYKE